MERSSPPRSRSAIPCGKTRFPVVQGRPLLVLRLLEDVVGIPITQQHVHVPSDASILGARGWFRRPQMCPNHENIPRVVRVTPGQRHFGGYVLIFCGCRGEGMPVLVYLRPVIDEAGSNLLRIPARSRPTRDCGGGWISMAVSRSPLAGATHVKYMPDPSGAQHNL